MSWDKAEDIDRLQRAGERRREQMDRLERKLDWLHWALVEVDTHRLYGAGYTDKEIQRLHMMNPPWPGDLP